MNNWPIDVLTKHRGHLARSIEQMEAGQMNTSSMGRDTTQETITQFRIWMSEIDSALARSRGRKI